MENKWIKQIVTYLLMLFEFLFKTKIIVKDSEKVEDNVVSPVVDLPIDNSEIDSPADNNEIDLPVDGFDEALKFVLKWEGGYSNDPNDPGGETNFGISKRAYPQLDIENLTIYDVKEIYYQNYWLKSGCDKLTPPLDLIVFDTAVNMGVSRAGEFLKVSVDWRDYLLLRLYTYSKFKQAPLYFRGWANRTLNLYKQVKEEE